MATYRKMFKDKDGNNIIPAGFVDAMYPIGSIYISATMSTVAQVQNAFGGTWVKWGAGRVPVGVDTTQTEFNTVGKTGGEKTHTLTVGEMPSHQHRERGFYSIQGGRIRQWKRLVVVNRTTTCNRISRVICINARRKNILRHYDFVQKMY